MTNLADEIKQGLQEIMDGKIKIRQEKLMGEQQNKLTDEQEIMDEKVEKAIEENTKKEEEFVKNVVGEIIKAYDKEVAEKGCPLTYSEWLEIQYAKLNFIFHQVNAQRRELLHNFMEQQSAVKEGV